MNGYYSSLKKKWLQENTRCYWCNCKLDITNITKDHLIPKSRGGTDNEDNLKPSCISCNYTKRAKLVSQMDIPHGKKIKRFVKRLKEDNKEITIESIKKYMEINGFPVGIGWIKEYFERNKL